MLPVITIARQHGSGGRSVGIMLSEKLGIKHFDKKLIAIAAKKSGFSEEVFKQADEKACNSLLYSMVMGNYPFSRYGTAPEMPINDKLFIMQTNIIREAAEEGPCVVIGRCGDYILREHPNVLNIFIHADKEDRVKRLVDRGDISREKAPDYISKVDKQRANYYNFYTNKDWGHFANYDLVLNSSTFSTEQCAEIVINAINAKYN
ncbi:MAG: cytidylate kinase-like family protein [Clostridia bacterium]